MTPTRSPVLQCRSRAPHSLRKTTVNKRLPIPLLAALLLSAASAYAAPTKAAHASSPAQVDGILDRVVDQLAAQRDVYWHHGDYPRIIALDRIITQADPHYLECYETGAWLMESQGDVKDAEAYYQENVANNPDTSESYFHLGFFYFNTLHDYPKAAETFRQGTGQADADINDWKMLAHAYEHAHEYAPAVETWQHIKAQWPDGLGVDHNLSRALAMQQAAPGGEAPAP